MLALVDKGMSREDAYEAVQRAAMRVWNKEGDFVALLRADPSVSAALTAAELAGLFDLGYHLKHVDTLFRRVFGTEATPRSS
jgi:adenylosuccinate lyase